jgi:general secretion pathway protein F/type IV pilus assembly protein PilC
MANYKYIAKTATGEEVTGVMQGESEAAVLRTLGDRDLFPVQVSPEEAAISSLRRGRIRPREVGVVFQQMADLLRAGVPMLRTLDTLIRACSNRSLAEVIREIRDEVAKGRTLADSLGDHPKVFPLLHAAMIYAGEEAGFLEDVLENLADFIERADELRSKVRGMLIYPCVVAGIGALLLIGILIILVPKFKKFFVNISLPLPTRIIFGASDLLVNHFGLLLCVAILIGIGIWALLRSDFGRMMKERLRMGLPFVGRVNRSVAVARFCRILGTMLHNGVPILRALDISKDATGSATMAGSIETAAENVRAGQPLAEPFKASGVFAPDVVEMIAVAEESNQMDKVLVQIAETVERRTNRQVDAVVRLIEPLILVLLAVSIGFVAVGILYPIFMMSQTLS